jgi:hypothetical protein
LLLLAKKGEVVKVQGLIICQEHGKQSVNVDKSEHVEFRSMLQSQVDFESRQTAKCPVCGRRCIFINEQ